MARTKSILFVSPAYHYSFTLRDQFRKMGWRADVYVPPWYPEKLRYDKNAIGTHRAKLHKNHFVSYLQQSFYNHFFFLYLLAQYRYLVFYGGMDVLNLIEDRIFQRLFRADISLSLEVAKIFQKKIIYFPSGCLDRETRATFSQLDGGNVCKNCGWNDEICNDERLKKRFALHRRYGDLFIGGGNFDSTQLPETHLKFMSVDLNVFKPGINIPHQFRLPRTRNLRIMHSFFDKNRTKNSKNIKGSSYVLEASSRLKQEGLPVEYVYFSDIPLRHMRYYQVQADIVVDQLIYGWWGSTGVESMALGKPVVCYLRKEWKDFFYETFPEYDSLPIVEATCENIYEVLKELVVNKEFREAKGKESRVFAERHFDVVKNAAELEKVFLNL